jgi:hypothetical protein
MLRDIEQSRRGICAHITVVTKDSVPALDPGEVSAKRRQKG